MNMKRFKIGRKQISMIVGAVVVFLLLMDLNSRILELVRQTNQSHKGATEVMYLTQTLASLEYQITEASLDSAVESWAYEHHMVRPGDKLIVPIPPAGVTPQPVYQPTPTPMAVENWQIWWALFFGE
jgi:hypothetical protein